jgi:ribosome-associated heat shock protein Hsp15
VSAEDGGLRLDRWLWAARFYKTRGLATTAIEGGKVRLNGSRAKKSKEVKVGDLVRIMKMPNEIYVRVQALSPHRRSAPEAAKLYEETAESIDARELMKAQSKSDPLHEFKFKGKPSKKERRDIDRFRDR